jgi:hypothetical protein
VVDVATAVRSDQPSRQVFAGRAGVMVLFGVVDEVLPGEEAAWRCLMSVSLAHRAARQCSRMPIPDRN